MTIVQKIGLAVAVASGSGFVICYIRMIRTAVAIRRVQRMIDDLEKRKDA